MDLRLALEKSKALSSMKYYGYKFLLSILHLFVYLKRGFFWIGQRILTFLKKISGIYTRTLGLKFYKLSVWFKKIFDKIRIPFDSRFVEFIGSRGTLQVVFFLIMGVVMIPHSTLYSRDVKNIPGQQTLLYQLIGPGDQDFPFQEIDVEEVAVVNTAETDIPAWKQCSAGADSMNSQFTGSRLSPEQMVGVSFGGSAVAKPSIIPGATVAPGAVEEGSQRTGIVEYEVQSGDVIGSIAARFGVSIETVLWANNLSLRSYIRPGDKLKIPPASGVLHVVKSGDTVSKIARTYNAEADEIVKANKLQKDGADIVIGEELFIPGGEKPVERRVVVATPSRALREVAAPPPSVSAPAGSGYLWPTSVRHITQYFGWKHTGVDIAGPVGTPLYASKAGTVIKSQCGWNGGYGCYVIIDHGGGVNTLYGHASQLYVSVGDAVEQGQVVAAMGSTGRSTGPHLHFEVRVSGARVNPLKYTR